MRKLFTVLFILGLTLGCKPNPTPDQAPQPTPKPGEAVCKEHPPGDGGLDQWQCRDAAGGFAACPSGAELDALKSCP